MTREELIYKIKSEKILWKGKPTISEKEKIKSGLISFLIAFLVSCIFWIPAVVLIENFIIKVFLFIIAAYFILSGYQSYLKYYRDYDSIRYILSERFVCEISNLNFKVIKTSELAACRYYNQRNPTTLFFLETKDNQEINWLSPKMIFNPINVQDAEAVFEASKEIFGEMENIIPTQQNKNGDIPLR